MTNRAYCNDQVSPYLLWYDQLSQFHLKTMISYKTHRTKLMLLVPLNCKEGSGKGKLAPPPDFEDRPVEIIFTRSSIKITCYSSHAWCPRCQICCIAFLFKCFCWPVPVQYFYGPKDEKCLPNLSATIFETQNCFVILDAVTIIARATLIRNFLCPGMNVEKVNCVRIILSWLSIKESCTPGFGNHAFFVWLEDIDVLSYSVM